MMTNHECSMQISVPPGIVGVLQISTKPHILMDEVDASASKRGHNGVIQYGFEVNEY